MISRDASPIAHIPPRPAINLRPTWPKRVEPYKNCWELAAEEEEARRKAKRDEAMWRAVCDVASSRGGAPQARMPLGSTETAAGEVLDDGPHTATSEDANASVSALEDQLSGHLGVPYEPPEWQWKPEFAEAVERSTNDAIRTFAGWKFAKEKIGTTVRIKLPDDYKPSERVRESTESMTTTQAGRLVTHSKDCGYWTDQYPWECDCGAKEG